MSERKTTKKLECTHQNVVVEFDQEAAKNMKDFDIRTRWPRFNGACPDCGRRIIKYASQAHYIYGDW